MARHGPLTRRVPRWDAAKPALPDVLSMKSLKALLFLVLGLLAGTAISNF